VHALEIQAYVKRGRWRKISLARDRDSARWTLGNDTFFFRIIAPKGISRHSASRARNCRTFAEYFRRVLNEPS